MQSIFRIPRSWDRPAPSLRRAGLLTFGIVLAESIAILADRLLQPTLPFLLLGILRTVETAILLMWGSRGTAGVGLRRSLKDALITTGAVAGVGVLFLALWRTLLSSSILQAGQGLACMEIPALVLFLLTSCLISPIAEELFFRGILYRKLRETYGMGISLFAVSAVFGLIHLWLSSRALLPFLGSVLFCIGYEKTKTILTPVFLHIAGNLIIYLSPFLGFI